MSEHTQAKRVGWVLRGTSYPAGATTMVFVVLAERSNAQGVCWPSVATLSAEARCSPRAAQYALRQLERDGWIAIGHQRGPNGANLYRIHLTRLEKAFETAEAVRKARLAAEFAEDALAFAEPDPTASEPLVEISPRSVENAPKSVENSVVRVGISGPQGGKAADAREGGCNPLHPRGATHCTLGVQPIAPKPQYFPGTPKGKATPKKSFDYGEAGTYLPAAPAENPDRTLHSRPP